MTYCTSVRFLLRGGLAALVLTATLGRAQSPVSVNFGGQTHTNQGLVGVGRLPSNLKDKFGETFGSFSAFMIDPLSWQVSGSTFTGTLYAQPDRGYNAVGTTDYTARFNIISLSFTPSPSGGTAQNQVRMTLSDTIQYKEASGTVVGSLDAISVLNRPGFPALPGANGKISLDPEGLVRMRDGSLWISDEYGPYIYKFSSSGTLLSVIRPPEALIPKRGGVDNFASNNPTAGGSAPVPADPETGRQNNQGLEGLTISPDSKKLFTLLQSATRQDGGTGGTSAIRFNTRLLAYDITGATPVLTGEYVFQLPTFQQGASTRVAAQSEILALNNTQFLVIARDSGNGRGLAPTSVYRTVMIYDITNATNIAHTAYDTASTPVAPGGVLAAGLVAATRAELININDAAQLAKFGLHNGPTDDMNNLSEKWEGLALRPALDPAAPNDAYLFIGNDNDFITTDGLQVGSAYNAGVDNDSMVLVYRVTLPTYVDPLAYDAMSTTGVQLARTLSAYSVASARLGTRDLGGQLASLRLDGPAPAGLSAFAGGDWAKLDRDAQAGFAGYGADGWAVTGGVQYGFSDGPTFGLAAIRTGASADLAGNLGSLDSEGTGVGAFASYSHGGFYAQTSFAAQDWKHETTRQAYYGLNADGRADGRSYALQGTVGWRFDTPTFKIAVETGYDGVRAHTDAFTETGAIHQNLDMPVLNSHSDLWHGSVQVGTDFRAGEVRLMPYVRVRYERELDDKPNTALLTLAGKSAVSGASLSTVLSTAERDQWRGAVGLGGAVGRNLWLNLEAGSALSGSVSDNTSVSVSLRCSF